MSAETLLAKLDKVTKKTGGGWMARCPAHKDGRPSLAIDEKDGRVLLKCFAGCTGDAIMQAVGLSWKDLSDSKPQAVIAPATSTQTLVETYKYTTENGDLLYEVCRYHPKTFRQRRPDGAGGWLWNMTDVRRVPYRLPEVMKAQTVAICEGEKDANVITRLGWCGTATVGGSKGWLAAYADYFSGKDVLLFPDQDEAGKQYRDAVLESVGPLAKTVRVVNVSAGCKDVAEFAMLHGDNARERIDALIADAPTLTKGIHVPIYTAEEAEARYQKFIRESSSRSFDLSAFLPALGQYRPLVPGELVAVIADTGVGKCLGIGTPVLMFDGSLRAVESIRAGDLLMGPDSKARTVSSTTSGIGELYRVEQNNGDTFICNDEHLLCVETTNNPARRLAGGKKEIISAKDFHAKSAGYKHTRKGYKAGVSFAAKEIPIAAYFVGLWLGDGSSSGPNITTGDTEIEAYLESFSKQWKLGLRYEAGDGCNTIHLCNRRVAGKVCGVSGCKQSHSCGGYCKKHYMEFRYRSGYSAPNPATVNALKSEMRKLNLLHNKHIPASYKVNTRAVRLELLAGLIDSDGYKNKTGVGFCNTNESIAQDVCWIARSLGFRASITKKKTTCKIRSYNGVAWVVNISGNVSEIPCLLRRKLGTDKTKYKANRYGIDVQPIGRGEYFGFTLAEPDGLFLLGDFTVTHNTAILQNIARAARPLSVLFFELELPIELMFERAVAMANDVSCHMVEREYRAGSRAGMVGVDHIYVCDNARMTTADIERVIVQSELKIGKRPAVVCVDYIGLLSGGGKRYERTSDAAEDLKRVAKSTGTIIILCAQVHRSRESDEIGLHDAKDSGSIEASCGMVIGAWRDPADITGGTMVLKVLKCTKGKAGLAVTCDFEGSTLRITERR